MEARAQCMPYLSKPDCRICLSVAAGKLGMFSGQKQYAQIFLPSCYAQYEVHDSVLSAPLAKPTDRMINDAIVSERKLALKWHIISTVAGTCLLSVIVGLCAHVMQKMKRAAYGENRKDDQLLDLGNSFNGNVSNTDLLSKRPLTSLDIVLMQLDSIREATNSFSNESDLGKGGFGPVYKVRKQHSHNYSLSTRLSLKEVHSMSVWGTLVDAREIAVKRLSKASGQGLVELKNEVTLIARLQHRNLVKLLGCCLEEHEKLLIYEYMPNKSLDFFLFGIGF